MRRAKRRGAVEISHRPPRIAHRGHRRADADLGHRALRAKLPRRGHRSPPRPACRPCRARRGRRRSARRSCADRSTGYGAIRPARCRDRRPMARPYIGRQRGRRTTPKAASRIRARAAPRVGIMCMIQPIAQTSLLQHCWRSRRAESWAGGDERNAPIAAPHVTVWARPMPIGCFAGSGTAGYRAARGGSWAPHRPSPPSACAAPRAMLLIRSNKVPPPGPASACPRSAAVVVGSSAVSSSSAGGPTGTDPTGVVSTSSPSSTSSSASSSWVSSSMSSSDVLASVSVVVVWVTSGVGATFERRRRGATGEAEHLGRLGHGPGFGFDSGGDHAKRGSCLPGRC